MSSPAGEQYDVEITSEGLRHLNQLPQKIREAALAALHRPIRENPYRLGKRLTGELDGLFSARRGDYRIIYSADDTVMTLLVHRVQHRGTVYRQR